MVPVTVPDNDAGAMFAACATRTRNVATRTSLLAQRGHVEARAALYLLHGEVGTLDDLEAVAPDGVDAADLGGLYDRVLVKGGERPTYLHLRGRSRFNRCPLCAQRDVKTLDHYLPKDSYPELAVYAANLVPACFECNHAKLNYVAAATEDLLFHPYFDDWSAHRLVRATIDVGEEVAVDYSIRAPADAEDEIVERARAHFRELSLGTLYSQQAGVELVDRKLAFRETFAADGAEGLRDDLQREARSRRRANRNSWSAALYRALARSDEFCLGGFEAIEEP
ncbi:HNH endonuclease [Sphingopyxis sp. MSC1_008]|jgi:hypothetical protein|uniref:HNH endonuclease n=1 Tax=Sphingopyxis sp. MSC1_008 TaxID=2909265 RepID=UPI0020BF97D6|nr:hypothetical protein [Sphingopyxis sp. MSC1_008]